jgi:hypothetical protein
MNAKLAVACTPPAVVGALIATEGNDVYPLPAAVLVIAVTVPPLEMFTPLDPAAKSMAPVPLDWKTWEMLVSEPWVLNTGEVFVAEPDALK